MSTQRQSLEYITATANTSIEQKQEVVANSSARYPAEARAMWDQRIAAARITLEKTDHAEPEDILASVAEKERRILAIVEEMRELVMAEAEHAC